MIRLVVTREQFVFITRLALDAAVNQIDTSLPDSIGWDDRQAQLNKVDDNPLELTSYERGCVVTAGEFLASLGQRVTGNSLAVVDALNLAGRFDAACARYVARVWENEGRNYSRKGRKAFATMGELWKAFERPDLTSHAEAFADMVLGKQ